MEVPRLADGVIELDAFRDDDAEAIVALWAGGSPLTLKQARDWIKLARIGWSNETLFRFAIRLAAGDDRCIGALDDRCIGALDDRCIGVLDDRCIGVLDLTTLDDDSRVGFVSVQIAPDVQCKRFGRRAVGVACEWALRSGRWREIEAQIASANEASIKMVKALGFHRRFDRTGTRGEHTYRVGLTDLRQTGREG